MYKYNRFCLGALRQVHDLYSGLRSHMTKTSASTVVLISMQQIVLQTLHMLHRSGRKTRLCLLYIKGVGCGFSSGSLGLRDADLAE